MDIPHPTAIGVDCLKPVREEGVWYLLMWWSTWDIFIYVLYAYLYIIPLLLIDSAVLARFWSCNFGGQWCSCLC